jgi:hypothetical protein
MPARTEGAALHRAARVCHRPSLASTWSDARCLCRAGTSCHDVCADADAVVMSCTPLLHAVWRAVCLLPLPPPSSLLPSCPQFFNALTREHLVSWGGQQRPINLGDGKLRWEQVDRVRAHQQHQHARTPGAAAGAGGQHQPKPHTPAEPKVNPAQVSTEPPAPGFKSPQTSVNLIGKRIRVWWPDDRAWYAGEVKVSCRGRCCCAGVCVVGAVLH